MTDDMNTGRFEAEPIVAEDNNSEPTEDLHL